VRLEVWPSANRPRTLAQNDRTAAGNPARCGRGDRFGEPGCRPPHPPRASVVVVIGLSLVGTGAHLIQSPLAVALALVCLGVGVLLGVVLVRTMRFWTDPNTGELWMAGGALFAIILVGTVVLRFGVRYAATGDPFSSTNGRTGPSAQQGLTGFLYVLSSDLLLLTLGLWVSRAVLLYLRYREHLAQRPRAHPSQPAG